MIEKDVIRHVKLNREASGTFVLSAIIETCFVDDAGAVVAAKPNPASIAKEMSPEDLALLAPLFDLATALHQAELARKHEEAKRRADEAAADEAPATEA